jgi:hypothetical protein
MKRTKVEAPPPSGFLTMSELVDILCPATYFETVAAPAMKQEAIQSYPTDRYKHPLFQEPLKLSEPTSKDTIRSLLHIAIGGDLQTEVNRETLVDQLLGKHPMRTITNKSLQGVCEYLDINVIVIDQKGFQVFTPDAKRFNRSRYTIPAFYDGRVYYGVNMNSEYLVQTLVRARPTSFRNITWCEPYGK